VLALSEMGWAGMEVVAMQLAGGVTISCHSLSLRSTRWYKLFFIALFLSVAVVISIPVFGKEMDTEVASEQIPSGGDFTLQSNRGPVSLRDLRGKIVLLYFGYTRCPDICPTSLSFVTQVMNGLTSSEAEKVKPIFISIDSAHDTPDSLAEYADHFHPNMLGLTGTEKEVAAVAGLYGVKYYEVELKGSAFGYSVNHSSATYLITPDGKLRFVFPHATPSSVILEAVKYVLSGS